MAEHFSSYDTSCLLNAKSVTKQVESSKLQTNMSSNFIPGNYSSALGLLGPSFVFDDFLGALKTKLAGLMFL